MREGVAEGGICPVKWVTVLLTAVVLASVLVGCKPKNSDQPTTTSTEGQAAMKANMMKGQALMKGQGN